MLKTGSVYRVLKVEDMKKNLMFPLLNHCSNGLSTMFVPDETFLVLCPRRQKTFPVKDGWSSFKILDQKSPTIGFIWYWYPDPNELNPGLELIC